MFVNPETNETEGLEIKSTYAGGFRMLEKSNKPKEDHLKQVLIYMSSTNIKTWWILYIGRDNGFMLEFKITKVNDKFYCDGDLLPYCNADLYDKFYKIEQAIKIETEPKREFTVLIKDGEVRDKVQCKGVITKSDWQCLYCQWLNLCWKNEL